MSKFEFLINKYSKQQIEDYYNNHSLSSTARYMNTSLKTLNRVLDYYGIPKHNHADSIKFGCIEKHGVDNVFQLDFVKDSSKDKKLLLYGSANYNNRQKAIETSNEIYGQGNYNNRQKAFQTYKDRTGLDNPFQDIDHLNQCIIDKYGSLESFYKMRTDIIIQNLEDLYNVCNVSQIPEVAKKKVITSKHATASDGTCFDSSWEVKVYEYCLDHLIDVERNISIDFNYGGKHHRTFIDFKFNNQLYEVKGNHLLDGCFDYKMIIPIEVKLDLYRKNNVTIITDICALKNRDKFVGIDLVDINEFN